ncbi:lipase maturation factor 2 [Anopheles darlingi]|uniref:Lipase maturation factor n=1 Tax=Anopheles darlingi TaxID=43151 RepID=W5JUK3_ANODA|nr:lipase maturation factor 1-like [Anopheles darlingi]ETN68032.1 lipase maturation factor 2 [Anopheles darlingi]
MEKPKSDHKNEPKPPSRGLQCEDVPRVRNVLLRAICAVYLLAFVSFYCQAEGLYGETGILPAHRILRNGTLKERLNLLQLGPFIGLGGAGHAAIDLLCLIGAAVAFLGLISRSYCRLLSFIVMWTLYFSLVQVSQSFRQQADHLLLEAGFLCILLAPTRLTDGRNPMEDIALLLLKWLVFRFMFASGSVKLASGCPLWWSLDGLRRHYETMPLPTSYSWYTYQLPEAFHRLSTIYVYLSELVVPWLFFAPNRVVRRFALVWHVFLHANIIGCGNYGFLSPLVLTLMVTLLDDDDKLLLKLLRDNPGTTNSGNSGVERRTRGGVVRNQAEPNNDSDRIGNRIVKVIGVLMVVGSWIIFGIGFSSSEDGYLTFKTNFSKDQYLSVMPVMLLAAPLLVFGLLVRKFLKLLSFQDTVGSLAEGARQFTKNLGLLISTIVAFTVFFMSIVPHSRLLPSTAISSPVMTRAYGGLHSLYVVNQYGRHLTKMRPVRREIILEYADDLNGTWQEYGFDYKPWTVERTSSLPYAGLYFPRFDFKFYDAAASKLDAQKWFYPMVLRLLQHQLPVLDLFDGHHVPFKAPRFIRASLYQFSYTTSPTKDTVDGAFWERNRLGDYFSVFSLDAAHLQEKLKQIGYWTTGETETAQSWNWLLRWLLDAVRRFVSTIEGSYLVTGLLMAALSLNYSLLK